MYAHPSASALGVLLYYFRLQLLTSMVHDFKVKLAQATQVRWVCLASCVGRQTAAGPRHAHAHAHRRGLFCGCASLHQPPLSAYARACARTQQQLPVPLLCISRHAANKPLRHSTRNAANPPPLARRYLSYCVGYLCGL